MGKKKDKVAFLCTVVFKTVCLSGCVHVEQILIKLVGNKTSVGKMPVRLVKPGPASCACRITMTTLWAATSRHRHAHWNTSAEVKYVLYTYLQCKGGMGWKQSLWKQQKTFTNMSEMAWHEQESCKFTGLSAEPHRAPRTEEGTVTADQQFFRV